MSSGQKQLYAILVVIGIVATTSLYVLQNTLNITDERSITLIGNEDTPLELSLTEIQEMDSIERFGSFHNSYGNIRGAGTYVGVLVSDLINLIGGMEETDIIHVNATDYGQVFTYQKIYPSHDIYDLQGDMVLAYGYNGTTIPEYEQGFRLAFLPEDGLYTNDDANQSSSPEFFSGAAGPQSVSNVVSISIVSPTTEPFIFQINFGENVYRYTMNKLMSFDPVTGEGGYLKSTGTVVGQFNYTGVQVTDLLDDVGTTGINFTLEVVASDGYSSEYNQSQVEGVMEGFDSSTKSSQGLQNFTMILAYHENGEPLSEGGPLRIVFLNEDGYLSEGRFWAKFVVRINIIMP